MTDDAPSDTLRERADESRWKLWLLMNADRRVVAGVLLLAVFLSLGVAAALAPGVADTLRNSDSVDTVFQGLLTATITGVTLVLTLNQLVLSQELGAVGDQRERMEGAMSFRDDAADLLEAPVAPARPAQFLRAFVQVAGERARDLRATVGDGSDAGRAVADLTDSLVGNADRVADSLDGATFGEFDVVAAALDFNYSWKVFAARRIDAEYGDDLTDEGARRWTASPTCCGCSAPPASTSRRSTSSGSSSTSRGQSSRPRSRRSSSPCSWSASSTARRTASSRASTSWWRRCSSASWSPSRRSSSCSPTCSASRR
ncbi:hypothetical protein [Halosegnis marinus]|uniref:hypothetical protein n=1 Tax=Halosegnis marinus TaxID=3034023 RepID=UPI00360A0976